MNHPPPPPASPLSQPPRIPPPTFPDPLFHFQIDDKHSLTISSLGEVLILTSCYPPLFYPSIRSARAHWPDARPDAYGVTDPIQHHLLLIDPPAAFLPYTPAVARWLIHYRLRAIRKLQRLGSPLLPPDDLDTSVARTHTPIPQAPRVSSALPQLARYPHVS